jgi:hypothetical protein
MHLLAEGERMLEGGCFDFSASKCSSTFYEVVQDFRVGCLVTAGGNIVPILPAVKAAAHNVRILLRTITVSGYSSASSGGYTP